MSTDRQPLHYHSDIKNNPDMESNDEMKTSRKRLTSSTGFLRLKRIEEDSIRSFIQKYDAHDLWIQERAKQPLGDDNFTTETTVSTSLKFCVDRNGLE